jgi:predicted Zn-dependent peptidase
MSWAPYASLSSAAAAIAGRWTATARPSTWVIGVDGGDPLGQAYLMRRRVDNAADVNLVKTGWNQKMAFEGPESLVDIAGIERARHLAPGDLWWLDPAELPRVPPRHVETWTRQVLRPDGATLIAVGRFDPAAMRTEITRWFETWRPPSRSSPPGPARAVAATAQSDRVALIPTEQTTQAEITLECRVASTSLDDLAPWLVATWLRSTLWQGLRTETGQTYGVNAWLHGDVLTLQTRVPNAVGASVVAHIRDQLRAADTVDEGELGQIAAVSARRAAVAFQSTEQVVDQLTIEIEAGITPGSTMRGRAARLAAVDLAAFRAVLGPCVGHEIVTIVGAASVGDELRAASIPVYRVSPPTPSR